MADITFKINGADYPTGDIGTFLASFNIDECAIYHQWTGEYYEDISGASVNGLMIAAFMQIAYMRGNPGISPQAARKAVGESNFTEALADFNAAQEETQVPLAPRPSEPAPSGSPGNKPESKPSSGEDSTPSSVIPINAPKPSGSQPWEPSVTSGSATSAN